MRLIPKRLAGCDAAGAGQGRFGRSVVAGGASGLWSGVLLLGLLLALQVHGQMGISVSTDRQKYLRYEPIRVRVLLRNYSGNTLVFGAGTSKEGYVDFTIDTDGGFDVAKLDRTANLTDSLILGAGETKELSLILNNLYDMQKEGVYTVSAQLGHRRLANDYVSQSCVIEVRDGLEVWSRSVGMPTASSASNISARKASLLLFHQDPGDMYCLKIEDEAMVYGVVRLGPRILGGTPDCDVDAVSNIHILFQSKSRLYSYCVYDCNGQLKQDRFYLSVGDQIPRLHRDPDIGRIMVIGGRVGVPGVDFEVTETQGQEVLHSQPSPVRAVGEGPVAVAGQEEGPVSPVLGPEGQGIEPGAASDSGKKKGWRRLRFWDRSGQ